MMRAFLKLLLPMVFFLVGASAWATPQADARLIAQREYDKSLGQTFEVNLRSQFATAYFKPISDRGVEISDKTALQDLVPDEDIQPFAEDFMSAMAEKLIENMSPHDLAMTAAVLRANKEATMSGILSKTIDRTNAWALEHVRRQLELPASDEARFVQFQEMIVQLEAIAQLPKKADAELQDQSVTLFIVLLGKLVESQAAIKNIEKPINNPVTLAAVETNGVLKFANPVQKRALIRLLSTTEKSGGIRFLRPPS